MAEPLPNARHLTAEDLGIGASTRASKSNSSSFPDTPSAASNDPKIVEIQKLLNQFGGVILTGPPGTGKSWLAAEAASAITDGDHDRQEFVQFHASYQFEDFMVGYRPKSDGNGFEQHSGVFLRLVDLAHNDTKSRPHVIVVDELSRADAARVFGEALTYIEKSKRGIRFTLSNGAEKSIPNNLYLIATMNPLDRGVDDVDAAFERRFAKLEMLPDASVLESILDRNGVPEKLAKRLLAWFRRVNSLAKTNPLASIGHTYFVNVVDDSSLQDVWNYQLKYAIERAFRYDEPTHIEMVDGWHRMFAEAEPSETGALGDEGS